MIHPRLRALFPGKPILADDDATSPTVIASRSVAELTDVQQEVVGTDNNVAQMLLKFMSESALARDDETRLLTVICDFAFQAFPSATHHVLAVRDSAEGPFRTLIARSREGAAPLIPLSRTIVSRVLSEGLAVLISRNEEDISAVHSVALSGMQTALCAPLINRGDAFGIIQLDIRHPAKGMFTRGDVDLLSVFASQVSLTLDHLSLVRQRRRAFQSTINALVHSLNLKDPETAEHSERVQAIALEIGSHLDLSDLEMEVLGVAAILHDLGKQGVRDEVLFKPDRLTPEEREEMARHAAYTQNILDKIEYPEELRQVPKIAAYHHEKMDGTGPFQIPGAEIPRASRIISVADAFDALVSKRSYKEPLPIDEVVGILERGKGIDWDAEVVRALRQAIPELEEIVYAPRDEAA